MKVVSFVMALLGVMTVGCERWKDWGNGRDASKGISYDVPLDAEF